MVKHTNKRSFGYVSQVAMVIRVSGFELRILAEHVIEKSKKTKTTLFVSWIFDILPVSNNEESQVCKDDFA